MGSPNLKLRGGTYYWRRKLTLAGVPVAVSLPLATGVFSRAHGLADRMAVAVEAFRMTYGIPPGISPEKLQQVFSDAMRTQLARILADQTGSAIPAAIHATLNLRAALAWEFLREHGSKGRWTLDDDENLFRRGYSREDANAVAAFLFDHEGGCYISGFQLDSYFEQFGITRTSDHRDRVERMVFAARAWACHEATKRLPKADEEIRRWTEEALKDESPFAYEMAAKKAAEPTPVNVAPNASASPTPGPDIPPTRPASSPAQAEATPVEQPRSTAPPARPGKPLRDAMEECIAANKDAGNWTRETIKQVRTAMALFEHACGGNIDLEDLRQEHVTNFREICRNVPGRWGRTTEEQAGGIKASLERGAALKITHPEDVGISQPTINKHITWITAVIKHAVSEPDENLRHGPAKPLDFGYARKDLGAKKNKALRKRDKRANWQLPEVARLLEAPIWTGCASLDKRLLPGKLIIHDVWYWMTLMLPLYGGRCSELAGLGLAEIYLDEPIPYFQIKVTAERGLKNAQSARKLPIHPELIRLGFMEYVSLLRAAGHKQLFPDLIFHADRSFAEAFRPIFNKWRDWAFPNGTDWRHRVRGASKDKDTHSFRGFVTTQMKGKIGIDVRCDILGHEGATETEQTYDDETSLDMKLDALKLLSPITAHIPRAETIEIHSVRHFSGKRPRSRRIDIV